jgi:hypothetical protein
VVNRDFEITKYAVGDLTGDQIDEAISTINKYCEPMAADEMLVLVGAMWAMTKQAKQTAGSMETIIKVYCKQLSEYPADIVREVLTKWPENSRWWPAWAELKDEIDWRNKREKMREALVHKKLGLGK